jgi:hypothetical protein
VRINRKRLEESMEALGRIGATAKGGLNRVALTDDDRRGRDLLVRWMREAGLAVTVDQMGNIFGQRAGGDGRPRLDGLARRLRPYRRQVRRAARGAVRPRDHLNAERPEDRDAASRGHGHLHQ